MKADDFFQKQILLKQVRNEGQEKLRNSSVLIVGAGGLGCPVLSYLSAAGIGKIGVCDYDKIEVSNLHRQVLFTSSDIGKPKAQVAVDRVEKLGCFTQYQVHQAKLCIENVQDLLADYDLIIDCSDNFSTKFLLHDACYVFKKDLLQASIYSFEGQIQLFNYSFETNRQKGCLRCLWQDIPREGCVGNCTQVGVLGASVGVLGSLQALEAIKLILGNSEIQHCQSILFDLQSLEFQKILWEKSTNCSLCSGEFSFQNLKQMHQNRLEDFEVAQLPLKEDCEIIDIRELVEGEGIDDRYQRVPLSEIQKIIQKIDSSRKYFFICSKGIRSSFLVSNLREQGYSNTYSLKGGLRSI